MGRGIMKSQAPPKLGVISSARRVDLAEPDALQSATIFDEADIIVTLLDGGTDVDLLSTQGWTALQVAAHYGRLSIAEILLSHGASTEIKMKGRTALHFAAAKGHTQFIVLLVENKAEVNAKTSDGQNALHLAAQYGRKEVIRVLVEGMINLEEQSEDRDYTPLHVACEAGHSQCVVELLSVGANPNARAALGVTPLMTAAIEDHAAAAIALLDSGAEVDAQAEVGVTASSLAAYNGSCSVLEVLISTGAVLDTLDSQSYDALRAAIVQKQSRAALLLLQQQYRIQTQYGEHCVTALHLAVSSHMCEVVRTLLMKGADIEACDADGDTALQYAVETNQIRMVQILLREGAQINKRNKNTGETVLHWAVRCGLASMTQALLIHGSDPSCIDFHSLRQQEHRPGHKEVTDAEFRACKTLVQTALHTKIDLRPAGNFEWPLEQNSDPQEMNQRDGVFSDSGETEPSHCVTNPIHVIEAQEAVESFISHFQDRVVHQGIRCTGPHCNLQPSDLRGLRYKCGSCDQVDLCSRCIKSHSNTHDHDHLMIKCRLPTDFLLVGDIDENTRRHWMLINPESTGDPQDISHALYAITDQSALHRLQADLSRDLELDWSRMKSLLDEPDHSFIVIWKTPQPQASNTLQPQVIRENKFGSSGPSTCKSDSSRPKGLSSSPTDDQAAIQDPEKVLHHKDKSLLSKVMLGMVKRFDYGEDKKFYAWAQEGRTVTRLIDLKPGAFDDKIGIEIRVVDIQQDSSYEALSYTWKETAYERSVAGNRTEKEDFELRTTSKVRHAVYCHSATGEEAFWTVNTGLRDALKRLRHPHQTRTFWIDQLSIDQRNKSERTYQVQSMMYLYYRAQRTVVWTGDEKGHTQAVFDIYEKIADARQRLGRIPTPEEIMKSTPILGGETSTLEEVFGFFQRPVFSRSWCIQEIVTSQKVVVQCGDSTIDWDKLDSATLVLSSRPWQMALKNHLRAFEKSITRGILEVSVSGVGTDFARLYGHLTEVIGIAELRRMFQGGEEMSLQRLLYTTSRFRASEAKDKIYCLLGMLNPSNNIVPDYEISDVEAFTTATRSCITQSKNLHICGMISSVSDKTIAGLPSWVPDYTKGDLVSAMPFTRPSPGIPYNACGDVPLTAAWPYERRENIVVISTCHVETITTCSQRIMSNHEHLPMIIGEWVALTNTVSEYPTGWSTFDAFALTCFADSASGQRLRPHSNERGFLNAVKSLLATSFMQYLQEEFSGTCQPYRAVLEGEVAAALMKEFEKFATSLNVKVELEEGTISGSQPSNPDMSNASPPGQAFDGEPKGGDKIGAYGHSARYKVVVHEEAANSEIDPGMEEAARDSVFCACHDRKLFITDNSYFGLGPRDVHLGDEVHILSGTKVPFVLRRVTAADADTDTDKDLIEVVAQDGLQLYRMVGECFVQGYMQGEVLSRDDRPWGGIAIC